MTSPPVDRVDAVRDSDLEAALADPAAYYADPEAILADGELSFAQKRRFLDEWMQDLTERQSADGEGLVVDSDDGEDMEADLVNRIRDCLSRLDDEGHAEGPGRRRWRRWAPAN